MPPRGCPPMFFRNDMILKCLSVYLVQRYDAKRVTVCAGEVAKPTDRREVDPSGVTRSRTASLARRTEHSEEWLCHLRSTRRLFAQSATGQISSMFYFNLRVKSASERSLGSRCSLGTRGRRYTNRPGGHGRVLVSLKKPIASRALVAASALAICGDNSENGWHTFCTPARNHATKAALRRLGDEMYALWQVRPYK